MRSSPRASRAPALLTVMALHIHACGPGEVANGQSSGTDATGDSGSLTETESGEPEPPSTATDTNSSGVIFDHMFPEEPKPPAELVIARGRGVVDGVDSFAPPQRFEVPWSHGLTALHHTGEGRTFIARWGPDELCLAEVSREGEALALDWRDCIGGDHSDAVAPDLDDDGRDELVTMSFFNGFELHRLEPDSPTGLMFVTELDPPGPDLYSFFDGMVAGPVDAQPGEEVIILGFSGDPVLGGDSVMSIVHGGAEPTVTLKHSTPTGRPHLGQLMGDENTDLLLREAIVAGSGDEEFFTSGLTLDSLGPAAWTLDANDDGATDIAQIAPAGEDCEDPGLLELYLGPFDVPPDPVIVEDSRVDHDAVQLVGDLDHDGVDELISVGVDATVCPGAARWTVTSISSGTHEGGDLCELPGSCELPARLVGGRDDTLTARLVDLDGDGNLDLAALVELTP